MRRLRSIRVVALSALVIAVLMIAEAGQAIAEGYLVDDENHMIGLVNEHRVAQGLRPLRSDIALQTVARRQSSRMVAAGYIYHNPNLGQEAGAALPTWLKIGENVGVGPGVVAVEDAFLASPHHRENIEDGSFNVLGLGAATGSGGVMFFTQNFANAGAVTTTTVRSAPSRQAAATSSTARAQARPATTRPVATTVAARRPPTTHPPAAPTTSATAAASTTTTTATATTTTTVPTVPTTAAATVALVPVQRSGAAGRATPSRVGMWRTIGTLLGRVVTKLRP